MGLKKFSWVEEGIRQELRENYKTKTRLGNTHKWRVRVWKSTWGKNLNYFPISFWSLTQSAPKQIIGGRERSELKMLTSESSLSQAKSKN